MKKKQKFSRAIQFKFLLLRLFTAAIIVVVSGTCIFFTQRITEDSAHVVTNRLPKLHATQEIAASVLSAGLYGTTIIREQWVDGEVNNREAFYEGQYTKSLDRAYLFLDALIMGTQSEAFRTADGGEMRRKWEALELTATNEINDPSPELVAHAKSIKEKLDAFENAIQQAQVVIEDYELQMSSATGTATSSLPLNTLALEESAVESLVGPVSTELREIQTLLESQVQTGVAFVYESNQSKQILISLVALLAVVLTLLAGLIFSRRVIIHPLEELVKTAEEMADGKLSRRVKIFSHDEIGKLAYTFNKMASRLETSYDNLEKIVKDKTDALGAVLEKFERKNEDLEKSQMATINLLEDLEEEKQAVEMRVLERTKELEQEKSKLLQVTSNMKGGGILLDKEFNVVFTNDETYSLLDVPKTIANSELLEKFFDHLNGQEIKEYYQKCIEGQTFHVAEIDGGGRVYEIFFHAIQGKEDQQATGYFILFLDITDAKLLERSKSELVAVASHQLRTPLTAMRGNVEMLIDESFGPLNKEQHELLADVDVSTIRLITMVNEMLDITKIEKGDLEMNIEKLNVKEAVESVVNDLDTYAKRHEFVVESTLQSDIHIDGDRVRVRQIFQNLIDNAIKYSSSPGKLLVSSTVKGQFVEIAFKDNGIGVPKNEQPKLFERFYRASNTAKTASSGSGLGLYIVKSIAQQLGGDIDFASVEGEGTTFFVTLPIAK